MQPHLNRCPHCGNSLDEVFRVHKNDKWICHPWTRIRRNLLLRGGDRVNRYELWPITRDHVGVGGMLEIDVGRKLVMDVSISNPNWTSISHVVDLVAERVGHA